MRIQTNYKENNINFTQSPYRRSLPKSFPDIEMTAMLNIAARGWHPQAILAKLLRGLAKISGITK